MLLHVGLHVGPIVTLYNGLLKWLNFRSKEWRSLFGKEENGIVDQSQQVRPKSPRLRIVHYSNIKQLKLLV
jgi:hypothetical protein